MATILQLDQPLPFSTPKGPAWAHFLLDYGTEHDILWGCFICDSGQCWWVANRDIRLAENWSLGIKSEEPM